MPELLVDLTIRNFAKRLASGDAAPGGGSASALSGAMAAALVAMAANLTVGRPKYAEHEAVMQAVLCEAERLRSRLLMLVDADTAAYENVMAAYHLPKENHEQKAARQSAIQEAFKHATDIPLATTEACMQVLNITALAIEYGNPNAASDATVAGFLAHAGMLGAAHDVHTNLRQIKDAAFCAAAEARLSSLVSNAEAALKRALGA